MRFFCEKNTLDMINYIILIDMTPTERNQQKLTGSVVLGTGIFFQDAIRANWSAHYNAAMGFYDFCTQWNSRLYAVYLGTVWYISAKWGNGWKSLRVVLCGQLRRKFKRSLKNFGCDLYRSRVLIFFFQWVPMLKKRETISKMENMFFLGFFFQKLK